MYRDLQVCPVSKNTAADFIRRYHRHCTPPRGCLFCIGLSSDGVLIGVAVVERVKARMLDDGWTAEVSRVAVNEGYQNACSMLYTRCWNAVRLMGYRRLVTYTLVREPGTSLKALKQQGWRAVAETADQRWDRPSRRRDSSTPKGKKIRWENTTHLWNEQMPARPKRKSLES